MTAPGGGGRLDLNPLWLPLAVETRGVNKQLEQVGQQGGSRFSQAFQRATGSRAMTRGIDQAAKTVNASMDTMAEHTKKVEAAQRKAADQAGKLRVAETQLAQVQNNAKATATQRATVEERTAKARRDAKAAADALRTSERQLQEQHRNLNASVAGGGNAFRQFFQGIGQGHRDAMTNIDGMGRGISGLHAKAALAGAGIGLAISGGIRMATSGISGMVSMADDAFHRVYRLGEQWDTVSDQIKVFTTTSGSAYESLNRSAERVASRLPGSLEGLGQNIGVIHSRLGLTGKTLEDFTRQGMEAGRMLGEPLNMRKLTGSMVAFGVEGDQATQVLNDMFNVSRKTGVPINDLIASTQKGAVFLKRYGLGFSESASLLAQFDAAGVDTSRMVRSLGTGMQKFAEQGKSPAQGLRDTLATVEQLMAAGENDRAVAGLQEIFGPGAGTQIFSLVETGALSLQTLQESFARTGDSIDEVAAKTDDLPEKVGRMANRAKVAARPLAEGLFAALGPQVDRATSMLENNQDAIVGGLVTAGKYVLGFGKTMAQMGVGVLRVWALLADASTRTVGSMLKGLSSLTGYLGGFLDTIGLDEMGQGLKDLGAAGSSMMAGFDKVPDILRGGADQLQNFVDNVPGMERGLESFGDELIEGARLSKAMGDSIITDIPDTKDVRLEGNVEEVKKNFADLGVQIETTPDGKVITVKAPTEQAATAVENFIKSQTGKDIDVLVEPGIPQAANDMRDWRKDEANSPINVPLSIKPDTATQTWLEFLKNPGAIPGTVNGMPVDTPGNLSELLGAGAPVQGPGLGNNGPNDFAGAAANTAGLPGAADIFAPGGALGAGGIGPGGRPSPGGAGGPGAALQMGPASNSPQDIGRYIYASALRAGYPPAEALAIVAYAVGESGLNPTSSGGQQGGDEVVGLFQEKTAFSGGLTRAQRMNPVLNTQAYLRQLAQHPKGHIYDRLLATSVGGPMHTGGPQAMNELMARARKILGYAGGGQVPGYDEDVEYDWLAKQLTDMYPSLAAENNRLGGVVGYAAGGNVWDPDRMRRRGMPQNPALSPWFDSPKGDYGDWGIYSPGPIGSPYLRPSSKSPFRPLPGIGNAIQMLGFARGGSIGDSDRGPYRKEWGKADKKPVLWPWPGWYPGGTGNGEFAPGHTNFMLPPGWIPNPDDILFPDYVPPGKRKQQEEIWEKLHPRIKPLGFAEGGRVWDPNRHIGLKKSWGDLSGTAAPETPGGWWGFGPYGPAGQIPPKLLWLWLKQQEAERRSQRGYQGGGTIGDDDFEPWLWMEDNYGTPSDFGGLDVAENRLGGTVGLQEGGFPQAGPGGSPMDDPTEPIDAAWLRTWWNHQQGHAGPIPIARPGGHRHGGPVGFDGGGAVPSEPWNPGAWWEQNYGRQRIPGGGGAADVARLRPTAPPPSAYAQRGISEAERLLEARATLDMGKAQAKWVGQQLGRVAKVAGRLGPVLPFITETIWPSASTSASDTVNWEPGGLGRGLGRQLGGIAGRVPGVDLGRDSVHAMLQPREFVVRQKQAERWLPLLHAINDGRGAFGMQEGGVVPEIAAIDQLAQRMGLTLGSGQRAEAGSFHNSGEARDYNGDEPAMTNFARYMAENYGSSLAELIHDAPGFTENIGEGKIVGAFGDGQYYNEAQAGEHKSHVHIAVHSGAPLTPGSGALPTDATGSGGSSLVFGNAFRTGPGGSGPISAETAADYAEETKQRGEAVTQADRAARNANEAVGDAIKARDDLQAELEAARAGTTTTDTGPFGEEITTTEAPDPKAIAALEDQLVQANRSVRDATEAATDAETGLADARTEAAKPSDVLAREEKDAEKRKPDENVTTLGGDLVSGALEALGFNGDVFGDPTQWGIWKLFTGGANLASETLSSMAEGAQKEGGGGGGGLGDILGGLFSGVGLPTPDSLTSDATVQPGPGLSVPSAVSATAQPGSPVGPFAGPLGPAPGPVGHPTIGTQVNVAGNVGQTPGEVGRVIEDAHLRADRQPRVGFPGGVPHP